jgi:CRISPR-associated protein Csh2
MSNTFNNRVFGCAIIKSINSNYNADFSHQPRTLPNGIVYATDKALKYTVRNYWKNALKERVFYFKSLTEEMSPRTLDETYEKHFGKAPAESDKNKLRLTVLKSILS